MCAEDDGSFYAGVWFGVGMVGAGECGMVFSVPRCGVKSVVGRGSMTVLIYRGCPGVFAPVCVFSARSGSLRRIMGNRVV